MSARPSGSRRAARAARLDAVEIQVFRHLLAAIPEEMGATLMRAALSPNIKERRDYSCALTDAEGGMAAQASHIPVHLGSTHVTARHVLEAVDPGPGDVVILNDPYAGGTHLPDVTLFAPVFDGRQWPAPMGVIVRAHHADVGGQAPGSMGQALDVHGEGLVIPPVRLRRWGRLQPDVLAFVLANTRTPEERRGDLLAQLAAIDLGVRRVRELLRAHGRARLAAAVRALKEHAAKMTRRMIRGLADGDFAAEDRLDGPGTPLIRVLVRKRGGRLTVDFTGTGPEVEGSLNANRAITLSAVFYVVRMMVQDDVPTNAGCLEPLRVIIPPGSLLDARPPAGVAGGNVETSQRLVDVLLAAFAQAAPGRVPAASQGTMNNLTVGGRLRDGAPFTFYETIAGGAGAGPSGPGASGLHTHMTNTLNTPIEAIEAAFPVRVTAYHLREGSGGAGRHAGGDGVVRELELLAPAQVTLMATRRREGPPGAAGGGRGAPGRDLVVQDAVARPLAGSERLPAGARVRIETPGGGGFGPPPDTTAEQPASPAASTGGTATGGRARARVGSRKRRP